MVHHNIVGPQIRRFRSQKNWSQLQLAAQLQLKGQDVAREYVAKVENQTRYVSDTELLFFSSVLNVPIAAFYPPIDQNRPLYDQMIALTKKRTKVVPSVVQVTASKPIKPTVYGNQSQRTCPQQPTAEERSRTACLLPG